MGLTPIAIAVGAFIVFTGKRKEFYILTSIKYLIFLSSCNNHYMYLLCKEKEEEKTISCAEETCSAIGPF